jgi:hypothetical protein
VAESAAADCRGGSQSWSRGASDRYRDSLVVESRADERDHGVPPHDVQAEQAVLGAILKNPRFVHQVSGKLLHVVWVC